MAESPKKRGLMFVAVALVLGMVAGAATIYGIGGFNGNGSNAIQTAQSCTLTEEKKETLRAAVTGDVATMAIADKPVPLAEIGFQLPDGTQKTFADMKDKVILLNLWATWCGPCREEMPDLAKLQDKYGSDDFEVFALNVDRNGGSKPAAFLREIQAESLGLYLDPSNKSFQAMRSKGLVFGLPTTMVLDDQGCVQGVMSGIAHWWSDDAKNFVEVAMRELSAS